MTTSRMPARFHNTPVKIIWDVREKVFGHDHVGAIMKYYTRNQDKKSDSYYGSYEVDHKVPMVTLKAFLDGTYDSDFLKMFDETEIVFGGYRVIGRGSIEWTEKLTTADFSHDLPKADLKCPHHCFNNREVQRVLRKMKDYLGGASLNVYKTTNSFHVYGARVLNRTEVEDWVDFLRGLEKTHSGVLDVKWLRHNKIEQPLRISETKLRGLPRLFKVI